MSDFYKITKAQAEVIGRFVYQEASEFDPFVGEQIDGTYLIEASLYERLKDRPEMKKVDFTKTPKVKKELLVFKPTLL